MSTSEDLAAAQAAAPTTPPQVLGWIAQHRPDLRVQVAANPATPPDVLRSLGALGDPAVAAALSARAGDVLARPGRARRRFPLWARVTTGVVGGLAVLGVGGWYVVDHVLFARGAASPEAAVTGLAEALGEGDGVGAYLLLAPQEVDGLQDAGRRIADRVAELDLGSGAAGDATFTVEGLTTDVREVSADRAEVELTGGTVTVRADAADAGRRALSVSTATTTANTTATGTATETFDLADAEDELGAPLTLTVVREDGRWFLSPLLTVSGMAGELSGHPTHPARAADLDRTATSPEEAVEHLLDGLVSADTGAVAGSLRTAQGLPLLESADALRGEGFATTSGVDVEDLDTRVEVDGDRALVTLEAVTVSHEGQSVTVGYADGCVQVTGEPEECAPDAQRGVLPADLRLVAVREDDGTWGVDVLQSLALLGTDVLEADDRDLLRAVGLATSLDPAQTLREDTPADVAVDGDYVVVEARVEEAGTVVVSTPDLDVDLDATDAVAVVTGGLPVVVEDAWGSSAGITFTADEPGTYRVAIVPADGERLPRTLRATLTTGSAATVPSTGTGDSNADDDWATYDATGFADGTGYLSTHLGDALTTAPGRTWTLQAPAGARVTLLGYDEQWSGDVVLVVDGREFRADPDGIGDVEATFVVADGTADVQVYAPAAAPGSTFSVSVVTAVPGDVPGTGV